MMVNLRRGTRGVSSSVEGIGLGGGESARVGGAGARMLEENWLDGDGVRIPGSNEIIGGFAAVKEDFLEADAILVERGGAVLFLPHGDVGGVVGGAVDLVEESGGEGRMAVISAAVLVVYSVVIPRIHEILEFI